MEDEGMMDEMEAMQAETYDQAVARREYGAAQARQNREMQAKCEREARAAHVEAEAWKVAQLAATIMGTTWFYESVGAEGAVEQARAILAESRRQAAAPAGEREDG